MLHHQWVQKLLFRLVVRVRVQVVEAIEYYHHHHRHFFIDDHCSHHPGQYQQQQIEKEGIVTVLMLLNYLRVVVVVGEEDIARKISLMNNKNKLYYPYNDEIDFSLSEESLLLDEDEDEDLDGDDYDDANNNKGSNRVDLLSVRSPTTVILDDTNTPTMEDHHYHHHRHRIQQHRRSKRSHHSHHYNHRMQQEKEHDQHHKQHYRSQQHHPSSIDLDSTSSISKTSAATFVAAAESDNSCTGAFSNSNSNINNNDRAEETLRKYRETIRLLKQQARNEDVSIQIAEMYHQMGLIHYQQGRYVTARNVLSSGIEFLLIDTNNTDNHNSISAAAAAAAEPELSIHHPLLPTLNEVSPHHLSNPALLLIGKLVIVQGKVYAAQGLWNDVKLCSEQILKWWQQQFNPTNDDSSVSWVLLATRAQILLGQCYDHHQRGRRPDIAMRYYQEVLRTLHYHQQNQKYGDVVVQIAETMYRIGNIHTSQLYLSLAIHYYNEALRLYQNLRQRYNNQNTTYDNKNCYFAAIIADEATVLASIGWIYLLQGEYKRAHQVTNQALYWMIHALGNNNANNKTDTNSAQQQQHHCRHKNVVSMQYQLFCIESYQDPNKTNTAQRNRQYQYQYQYTHS
jgi:tetratricopeptide (TPR) repeat protein